MVSQHSAAAAPMTADANLREQVQQRLRLDIVSGEIGPGTILSVPGLARTLGISTTPVREALRAEAYTQMIALPMIPKNVMEEIRGAQNYFEYRERCVFCDILHQEIQEKERIA